MLAEAVGLSVRSLQRRLSAAGTTYSRLVDEVRMRTALPLLEDPDILLTEIAYDLGYSHPAHFTRAFRRWAGVTPSEYRADLLAS
jgi:AraC-like DNA-binding protein